ncbi:MAG: acetyl-CoA carboxylase biotin carboxyl carrier protein [Pseudomonadota bacterium]|jgi:acetyl-CoA carboxylase biotin carboxyl carrier protein|nr:acetyl-CoA carboxylase biotin carboxyl carrier protein [Alphaproteobacteria bacterium]
MAAGKLDKEAIVELAEILKETDLSEIEYEASGVKIRVARQMAASFANIPMQAAPTAQGAAPAPSATHPGTVKSPMVGTVYLSPEPGAMPFVKTGDSVSAGQTLLIIEAMKVMNPIKAPKAGTVTKIFVKDAEPTEFDAPLLIIE